MKTFAVFAIFAALCVLSATCIPIEEFIDENGQQLLVRQKRVTCDLLSFEAKGIKLNHAACAAHCLALRKRGGRCNSGGVCVCR